jgi:hypothetical protein
MKSQKILFAIVALAVLWNFGQLHGIGQNQEGPQQWTVETHDNSNFPLVGKHRVTSCRECHLGLVFEGTPRECEACHWERRQDDRHQLRLGIRCGDCHTPYSWKNVVPNKWNHVSATGYPLEGVHRTLDCVDCHGEDGFDRSRVACFDCHDEDYTEARNPDHQAAGFPIQCQLCHFNQNAWSGAVFSHDRFLLKGVHKTTNCSACHSSGQYEGLSAECVFCHLDDYNRADDPDHKKSGFPTDCVVCHGTSANTWEDGKFSHTAFQLVGQHKVAQCSDCHPDGKYAGTSQDCVSCHLDDYNSADDPDHKTLNFPTDCVVCHGTSANTWENGKFAHTAFPLVGQHKVAQCSDCHSSGQYAGTSSACISCHLDDYNAADDPDHRALNFPTDCVACHGTSFVSWQTVTFDHSTYWTLKGAHTRLDCSDCHTQGYDLPQNCYGCHAQDYNSTSDPDHGRAGFPTDCEICHYPTHFSWSQAVFDHQFPIGSGKHSSASCSDCHVSSNYKEFSCLTCHTHDKTRMDNQHEDVVGYAYESQACYACHPQGRGQPI